MNNLELWYGATGVRINCYPVSFNSAKEISLRRFFRAASDGTHGSERGTDDLETRGEIVGLERSGAVESTS